MMARSRRRRQRSGIAAADPTEQIARLAQRSVVRARHLQREEPVRAAVPVGTLDDGTLALVDPAGMVQMEGQNWVLDWWIGSEDGWHFASSDMTVTQTLSGFSPVIRTTIHVPGGNIIHRVFGTRSTVGVGDQSRSTAGVVVEIENQCAVPVALAFVIRPLTLWGDGEVRSIGSDGSTITVDGSVGAILSRPIARRVVGPPGTVAIRLDLEDDEQPDGIWQVDDQIAEGAFVVPLPHTAVAKVLLPSDPATLALTPNDSSGGGEDNSGSGVGSTTGGRILGWEAPGADQVEAGWKAISKDMVSVMSPDSILDGLCSASQRFLMISGLDSFYESVDGFSAAFRNAMLTEALVTVGAEHTLEPIARALVDAERIRGGIRMDDRSDASVALLHSAGPLLVGSRSSHWEDLLLGPLAKAIHRLERGRGLGEKETGGDAVVDLQLRRSAALALARLAPALLHIEQPDVARAAHDLYHQLASRVVSEVEGVAHGVAAGVAAESDVMASSAFGRAVVLRMLVQSRDASAASDVVAFAGLGHLGVLAPNYDAAGVEIGSTPIDSAATALRLSALVDLFAGESQTSVEILPGWAQVWFGKQIEVSNVRTRLGVLSYALRWSENRPILLWEMEPAVGLDPGSVEPLVTAPVLDPGWHGHGWRGEAMLGSVEVSQDILDQIAERDRPKMAVSLGMKKPGGRR